MATQGFQGFPNFNLQGFPYANLPQQAAAAFAPQQFSNASQYGRFNGVNNNAFGLFPNQFGALFGYQPGGQMQFQPPYANNGMLGSNQGPGANPGMAPGAYGAPVQKMAPIGLPNGQASGTNGQYVNQAYQGVANDPALMHLLQSGRGGAFLNAMNLGPASFSVNDFNQANQTNAPLALTMATQGGQDFRNAVMQQNGWTQPMMNNWINQVAYEGQGPSYFRGFEGA